MAIVAIISLNVRRAILHFIRTPLNMSLNSSSGYIIIVWCIIGIVCSIEQIDKEHFKLYPYCGRMFGYDSGNAESRVVNSEDSLEHELYPWVVYVERKRKNAADSKDTFLRCVGTVIAYRYVNSA